MQFQFDANQDFQLAAINAVADLFEGQGRAAFEVQFQFGQVPAIPNRLNLSPSRLLENLQNVQRRSFPPRRGVPPENDPYHGDDALAYLSGEFIGGNGQPVAVKFPNFSVEMETGTGKTYVYLRTALELYRRYAFRKFIIVVPSVAIREGVIKTLQQTRMHFRQMFNDVPYHYFAYDSSYLGQVRQFALSDSVELMVMTLQAFRDANRTVIHQSTDRLQGDTPIDLIRATNPILILDEPQNMESDASIEALYALNPLFALRYSATHRVPYNVVYRLSPAAAYRLGLVKRIEVASSEEVGHSNRPYIRLLSTKSVKRTLTAVLSIHALRRDGKIAQETITVGPGASLYLHSGGLDAYQGYEVDEINHGLGYVVFANTERVTLREGLGTQRDALFEAQILYTIQEHIKKQRDLAPHGIKVLSLFFIDEVANYVDPDKGIIRKLFDQAWESCKSTLPDLTVSAHPAITDKIHDWSERSAEQMRSAYFASRRNRDGELIYEDSRTGTSQKDREAYELIMKDKERLLSFEEPVSFIFSHSALREGWDNPNIFQICTLNQTESVTRKRQEIGRGMRLCVNHIGERVFDERFNTLTVIANESYDAYVRQYQSEIDEEYLVEIRNRFGKPFEQLDADEKARVYREYGDFLPPLPEDIRKRATVRFDPEYKLAPAFQAFWNLMSQKTRYSVNIDSDKLVEDVVARLQHIHIPPPRVVITKAIVELTFTNVFEAWQMSAAKTLVSLAGRYPLPNLVDVMMQMLESSSPPMRLTKRTLLRIIRAAPKPNELIDNPIDWASETVKIIKELLSAQLIDGIKYERLNDWYELSIFDEVSETWTDRLERTSNATYEVTELKSGAIYRAVPVDSQIERDFAQGAARRNEVQLAFKLPRKFSIPTPIGRYNPDWAIAMLKDEDSEVGTSSMVYLIVETKGAEVSELRSTQEGQKIHCGRKHFCEALGIPYRVYKSADQIPQPSLIMQNEPCAEL